MPSATKFEASRAEVHVSVCGRTLYCESVWQIGPAGSSISPFSVMMIHVLVYSVGFVFAARGKAS